MARILLGLVLSLSFTGASFAELYKWVDEEGNVHYGDCPPADCKAEQIETAPGPSKEKIQRARERTQRLLENQKGQEEFRQNKAAKKRDKQVEHLAKKQRCLESRMQLAVLLEKHLPTYIDDSGKYRAKWKYDTYQGNREYLDESRRDSEIIKTKKIVKIHCIDQNISVNQDTARKTWIKSEHCASARADFKMVSKPGTMSPRSFIESQKAIVNRYCN